MENKLKNDMRESVMKNYKRVALKTSLDSNKEAACCSTDNNLAAVSEALGYSSLEYDQVPNGSNMGIGCGNPQAIASLKQGETVLDLGSGGGFDCFLASNSVGSTGKVIGVDMTPEMLKKARINEEKGKYTNTEFRLGEIEHLPVADASIDVIISNCVINLSPEKQQVFIEAFRVLKPGGRLAISDVVTTIELPNELKNDEALHCGCMAGASSINELKTYLQKAGFSAISIEPKEKSREFIKEWAPGTGIENYIVSATIEAVKKHQ
ncbi:MAG: arsenite S-adenosylmethyltransferase [Lutibacter sp.]|nr:MAG: arsenite S-adenosylmethyltransferase [Lutibacter sp.]